MVNEFPLSDLTSAPPKNGSLMNLFYCRGECLFAHRDIIDELDMSRLDEFNGRRQYMIEKEASKLREEEKKR